MDTTQRERCLFSELDLVIASTLLLKVLEEDPTGAEFARCAQCKKGYLDGAVGQLHANLKSLRQALLRIRALMAKGLEKGGQSS